MTEKDFLLARKTHLEELKIIANQYLTENKKIKDNHEHKWESEVIENNIKQLKRIITTANKGLEQDELEKYAASQLLSFAEFKNSLKVEFDNGETIESYMTRMMHGLEQFEIFTYSPGFSIVYDLYWIPDGTVGDQRNVALGTQSPDLYEKYCVHRIAVMKNEMLPYLQKKPAYQKHIRLLQDILDSFGKSSFLYINIVLITAAESLVRELCSFVYAKQNPAKSQDEIQAYIYETFNSLETLILKADWKEDIPIPINEATAQSRFITEPSLNKGADLMEQHKVALKKVEAEMAKVTSLIDQANSEKIPNDANLRNTIREILSTVEEHGKDLLVKDAKIEVTIRARLQFLLRRYKEDRNSIIHGNYADFDKGWKTYVYLSAITKIFELIKEYDEIYP